MESNQCMWSLWKPNPNVQDQKLFQSENVSDPFVSPDDQSIQADNEKRGDCRIVQPCHFTCCIRRFRFVCFACQFFFVVHFLIHVVLVFSHVAVGIDARATYRVRVFYIYLVPRVLRISLLHLPLLFWVCNNPLLSTAFVSKE